MQLLTCSSFVSRAGRNVPVLTVDLGTEEAAQGPLPLIQDCIALWERRAETKGDRTVAGEPRQAVRGLRALLDPPAGSDHTPLPPSEPSPSPASAAPHADADGEGNAPSVRATGATVEPSAILKAELAMIAGRMTPFVCPEARSPIALPAPGQRWANGARRLYVAQRRIERAAFNLDLVEAALAAWQQTPSGACSRAWRALARHAAGPE